MQNQPLLVKMAVRKPQDCKPSPMDTNKSKFSIPSLWKKRLIGTGLIILAILLVLCLHSFKMSELEWKLLNPQSGIQVEQACSNWMGIPGLYIAAICYYLFGASAYWSSILLFYIGFEHIRCPLRRARWQWISASTALILSCLALASQSFILSDWVLHHSQGHAGGIIGALLAKIPYPEALSDNRIFSIALLGQAIALIYLGGLTPFIVLRRMWIDAKCVTIYLFQKIFSKKKRENHWESIRAKSKAIPFQNSIYAQNISTEEPSDQHDLNEAGDDQAQVYHESVPVEEEYGQARKESQADQEIEKTQKLPFIQRLTQNFKKSPTPSDPSPDISELSAFHEAINPSKRKKKPTNASKKSKELPVEPIAAAKPIRPTSNRANAKTTTCAKTQAPIVSQHLDDYVYPPYELLRYIPAPPEADEAAQEEMHNMQQCILETLRHFNIEAQAGEVTRGPSITRYEFYPPHGLRVNRISNLRNDLMLSTQSPSINILAPIPGKNTVGIELANLHKTPVYLRELLESESFTMGKQRIPVALGKDVYGNTIIGDLAAMPHTLVAGTTGSGKSVCINSMIISLIYHFSPKELKLILIDPKIVEMQPYRRLPHLACPVVTEPGRVIGALRWAVNEMEHRYKFFSKMGVRNFEDFNKRPKGYVPEEEEDDEQDNFFNNNTPVDYSRIEAMASEIERDCDNERYLGKEEEEEELDFEQDEPIPDTLPYIVIIIDELADLMMIVKEDLENYIARLTQKARAAGIHLVVATQTPRSNVVTGIIKANIPSRIAFKVSSPLDSRIILDTDGAENLLGQGDFLFLPPSGISKMCRAQGAFVSDDEVTAVVQHCCRHAKQNFVQGVATEMNNDSNKNSGGKDNSGRLGGQGISEADAELYTRCLNLIITERKASTSQLQRRFGIGYGRAAKIMDLLEARGIISPSQGSARPREVLVEAPNE